MNKNSAENPLSEIDRERLIEAWRVVLELALVSGIKRIAADNMRQLIAERSPAQQIQQMEREARL